MLFFFAVNSERSLSPSVFFLARLLDTLDNAASVWTDVKSQAPITQQNLVPLTKLWSQKTEEEIEAYQSVVSNQVRFVMHLSYVVVVFYDRGFRTNTGTST